MRTPYQATVLRTDVNRALPNYIPEIFEECELAMDDMLRTKGNGALIIVFEFSPAANLE